MPYKVMIVDDEPMIRYGLVSCVEWKNEGFELIGEAANGTSALQQLEGRHVDIVITDIKMPLMDGLELSRQLKDLNPNVKVVLVTSYSDFEYAQEAVKLGVVVDYLLKPTMEPEDLLRIVRSCKQELDLEYDETQKKLDVQKTIQNYKYSHLKSQLKSMLNGSDLQIEWVPQWMEERIVVAIWHQYDADREQEKVIAHSNEWLENSLTFKLEDRGVITIISDRKGSAQSHLSTLHQRFIDEIGLNFTMGISSTFHHIKLLFEAYESACDALEDSFFGGAGKCYFRKTQQPYDRNVSVSHKLRLQDHDFNRFRETFSQYCATANEEASGGILKELYLKWTEKVYSRKQIVRQAQSMLTIMWSRKYNLKSEEVMEEIIDKLQRVDQVRTLQELIIILKKEFILLWDMKHIQLVADDCDGIHAIQLALSYIQENYLNELSLQEVADHVHMSKNYFSEQFKRRTGLNFIEFVIRLRIHYAKNLLVKTNLKINDIGVNSGFNSPKHFLKIFKREVKCTPTQYRQMQANQLHQIT